MVLFYRLLICPVFFLTCFMIEFFNRLGSFLDGFERLLVLVGIGLGLYGGFETGLYVWMCCWIVNGLMWGLSFIGLDDSSCLVGSFWVIIS